MAGKSNTSKLFAVINTIFMLVVMVVCIFPFLYVFSRSVSNSDAVMSGKVLFLPVGFDLINYRVTIQHSGFFNAYKNTVVYTFAGTLITLFVTALCAYPLSKKRVFGRNLFMKLFIVTMFFNGGLIPNFILVNKLGLMDKIWAIVLPGAFNQFFIILAMSFMQGIPVELEEAAAIDGLNPIKTLIQIILPLSKPVFATIALFSAVGIWNDWFTPMIYLSSNDKYPIMLMLRNIITGGDVTSANALTTAGIGPGMNLNEASLKSAAIMLVALPIVAVYPFVQKYFVKGAMIGSLKG